MKIGDKVRVVKLIDLDVYSHSIEGNEDLDEFLKYKHRQGRVVGFDNRECGATPKDPMILVEFSDKKRDSFWTEELKRVD